MRIPILMIAVAACGGAGGGDDGGDDAPGSPDAPPGSSDGPPGGSDDRLYPLDVGRTWTYDVTSTYPSCPPGVRTTTVTGTGTTDGRPTFHVTGFCGSAGNTFVDGDIVDEYYDWGPTGWYRALDEPVNDGYTWTTTNGSATFTQTYDDLGSHGGRDDCWQVTQNVTYTSYWIYCRGVGLVFYEIIDLGGGTIRAELTATSF